MINAIRLAHRPFGPFGRERARTLFAELVELTEARWGMANVIVDGYDDDQFRTLLANGLKLARELTGRHYCQSFKAMGGFDDKRRNWLRSLERLTAHPATAVIVGIWGRMDHWSVLAGVSERSLLFYDSDALRYLPLVRCSLTGSGKARRIDPPLAEGVGSRPVSRLVSTGSGVCSNPVMSSVAAAFSPTEWRLPILPSVWLAGRMAMGTAEPHIPSSGLLATQSGAAGTPVSGC